MYPCHRRLTCLTNYKCFYKKNLIRKRASKTPKPSENLQPQMLELQFLKTQIVPRAV